MTFCGQWETVPSGFLVTVKSRPYECLDLASTEEMESQKKRAMKQKS